MTKYILMVFAGACSFGILSTFVKLSYQSGYTAAEISFTQALFGMVFLWVLVFIIDRKHAFLSELKPANWRSLLFTGFSIGLTTYLYYKSVQYLDASVAIIILMQFTWLCVLIECIFFKQRPDKIQLLAIAIILIGTVVASGLLSTQPGIISLKGLMYAFGSALFYAIYVVANSKLKTSIQPLTKSAMIMIGSVISIFLVNANNLVFNNHFDIHLVKWALFLAAFGTIIPPVLFAIGIPRVGTVTSSVLMTAELPVAMICSHFILNEHVDGPQWTGIIIMLFSMILLSVRRNRS